MQAASALAMIDDSGVNDKHILVHCLDVEPCDFSSSGERLGKRRMGKRYRDN